MQFLPLNSNGGLKMRVFYGISIVLLLTNIYRVNSDTKNEPIDDMLISHYNLAFAKGKHTTFITDKCTHFAANI